MISMIVLLKGGSKAIIIEIILNRYTWKINLEGKIQYLLEMIF